MTYEIITELVRWVVPSGSWCFLDTSNSVPATKCQLFLLLLLLLGLLVLQQDSSISGPSLLSFAFQNFRI